MSQVHSVGYHHPGVIRTTPELVEEFIENNI
jgi:hypothetical protein